MKKLSHVCQSAQ